MISALKNKTGEGRETDREILEQTSERRLECLGLPRLALCGLANTISFCPASLRCN